MLDPLAPVQLVHPTIDLAPQLKRLYAAEWSETFIDVLL